MSKIVFQTFLVGVIGLSLVLSLAIWGQEEVMISFPRSETVMVAKEVTMSGTSIELDKEKLEEYTQVRTIVQHSNAYATIYQIAQDEGVTVYSKETIPLRTPLNEVTHVAPLGNNGVLATIGISWGAMIMCSLIAAIFPATATYCLCIYHEEKRRKELGT